MKSVLKPVLKSDCSYYFDLNKFENGSFSINNLKRLNLPKVVDILVHNGTGYIYVFFNKIRKGGFLPSSCTGTVVQNSYNKLDGSIYPANVPNRIYNCWTKAMNNNTLLRLSNKQVSDYFKLIDYPLSQCKATPSTKLKKYFRDGFVINSVDSYGIPTTIRVKRNNTNGNTSERVIGCTGRYVEDTKALPDIFKIIFTKHLYDEFENSRAIPLNDLTLTEAKPEQTSEDKKILTDLLVKLNDNDVYVQVGRKFADVTIKTNEEIAYMVNTSFESIEAKRSSRISDLELKINKAKDHLDELITELNQLKESK